jgi:hypothetical protein
MSRPPFSIWHYKHRWACIILLSALKYSINMNIPSVQTETVTLKGRRIRGIEYENPSFFKECQILEKQTIHGQLGRLKRTRSFIPTQINVKLCKQWTAARRVLNRTNNIITIHTRAVQGAMVAPVSKPPDLLTLLSFNDGISTAEAM